MDSSSDDDSFAWTDTSSENAGMDARNVNGIQTESESNSDYEYKEKLQKQLFQKQTQNMTREKLKHNIKKNKIKEESLYTEDSVKRKKHIKVKPQSDMKSNDISKWGNGVLDNTHDFISNDESYLNMKVKQEQMSIVTPTPMKSKKKKKHKKVKSDQSSNSDLDNQHEDLDNSYRSIKLENNSYGDVENATDNNIDDNMGIYSLQEGSADMNNSHKKKKSKKSKKNSSEYYDNDTMTEDKIRQDEIVADIPHKKKKKKRTNEIHEHSMTMSENVNTQKSNEECSAYVNDTATKEANIESDHGDIVSDSMNTDHKRNDSINHHSPDVTLNSMTRKVSRISNRIQFEDEEDSYVESPQNDNHNDIGSKRLMNFFRANNLKWVKKRVVEMDAVITQDDDIWILRCPHDIDLSQLKDTDVLLDAKCKIKLNGQTFDGNLNEDIKMTNLVSRILPRTYSISSVELKGTVDFHKRVPKTNYFKDNVIENNSTNFVPLPETKCRHPLFGTNYKQDIKISKTVADRLKATNPESSSVLHKKNKKKKMKTEHVDTVDSDNTPQSHIEFDPDQTLTKKKRKRKHTQDEGRSQKGHSKTKKFKHDPNSADVWGSEKAIEENLFNF